MAINQIEVIFKECPSILTAWTALRLELEKADSKEQGVVTQEKIDALLHQMALELEYNHLSDSISSNHYYPKGFEDQARQESSLKFQEKVFYKTMTYLNKKILEEKGWLRGLPPEEEI